MKEPIIKVERLSKKYIIGHQRENYTALRDVISLGMKNMFRRSRNIFSGQQGKISGSFEDFWALSNISFEINAGDRLGIIGRNGAGKSTLLKILSRITEPTNGRVLIQGRIASLLEVGTGFHPELTGRENIFLNGAILGMSRAEIKAKFDEIVDFAEIEKFLDTPVKRYSSGMYVRLAFAVAAHLEPDILIVDEVLAVGDAQFQKKCLGKMEGVSKNDGRTVLFVSHNMGVMAQFCNKGLLLSKGELIFDGTIGETIGTYISNQTTNQSTYQISNDDVLRKVNYFTKIFTSNLNGEKIGDFGFEDSIRLNFEFKINEEIPGLQIGIGLNDKLQNRVFTILKPVSDFTSENGIRSGYAELPPGIIAPNSYSFVFAIWKKGSHTFDVIENICPIHIFDTGSDFALYEGIDYGSVIINPIWQNV